MLIRKYDTSGPRYTSYPTTDWFVDAFVDAFGEDGFRPWLGCRNIGGIVQPLSVYVHLPFWLSLRLYCTCNKVATRAIIKSSKPIKYLEN